MDYCSKKLVETLGVDSESALLKRDGDRVDFMVTKRKQPNYLAYCKDPYQIAPMDPSSIVRRYTEHKSDLFAKVNLGLAVDSPSLSKTGSYIKQLHSSVLALPRLEHGPLYRGCDFSAAEVCEMERLKSFFIPSFTSCSCDRDKAYSRNTLLCIQLNYGHCGCCSITPELSDYFAEEREVLLCDYTAFIIHRVENVNAKKLISLAASEYLGAFEHI